MSPKLAFMFFVITLGTSFPFGYHTGVMSAPYDSLFKFITDILVSRGNPATKAIVDTVYTFCVATFVLGGMIGGFLGGFLSKKFGRKKSIYILSAPCILGNILMVVSKTANSFIIIIVGRLLVGIAAGSYSTIGPTYLSEVAPRKIRGAAGVLNQLVIVISILIAQILGLPSLMGTDNLWPYLLGLSVVCNILSVILLFFCPESPSYSYLTKNDVEAAEKALRFLRGPNADISEDLDELEQEKRSQVGEKMKVKDLFKIRYLRKALTVALVLHIGQQMTAINGILGYAVKLFKAVNLSKDASAYANMGIGLANLFWTIISIIIIDRIGRRVLLLAGFGITTLSIALFTVSQILLVYTKFEWPKYACIALLYIFISGFAIGPGPIPWFLVSEMFTQEKRDAVNAMAASVNWTTNVLVVFMFSFLIDYANMYLFIPFIVIMIAIIIFVAFFLPETKGSTPASIEEIFRSRYGTGKHSKSTSELSEFSDHRQSWISVADK